MRKRREYPNTVRYWVLYGIVTGVFIGTGVYLSTSDEFDWLGLVGSVASTVVAMVLVGQVLRLMIGTPGDDAQ